MNKNVTPKLGFNIIVSPMIFSNYAIHVLNEVILKVKSFKSSNFSSTCYKIKSVCISTVGIFKDLFAESYISKTLYIILFLRRY